MSSAGFALLELLLVFALVMGWAGWQWWDWWRWRRQQAALKREPPAEATPQATTEGQATSTPPATARPSQRADTDPPR